jgi:hypothetical protein
LERLVENAAFDAAHRALEIEPVVGNPDHRPRGVERGSPFRR